ncbi:MAG: isoprenoid biosynthesis glyoxalase ElbB [Bdellovibrionales bacterium]|nr:isoprenoid biosynthesis glyoxalase ElbB [Bdellovibrionales bacterium]
MKKKIAVILCGSGFKDGSEIHESVFTLNALSEHGADFQCFAQDAPQADVVDCLSGQAMSGTRNQRVESARIARGNVKKLSDLDPAQFDALILPGGFGAAKNLCDYAFKGISATVKPEVAHALDGFSKLKKPIGAICIAPMVLALHFKGKGLHLTLGSADADLEAQLKNLGHHHKACKVTEICVDEASRVVSTPAYMHENPAIHEVNQGITKLVGSVLSMI